MRNACGVGIHFLTSIRDKTLPFALNTILIASSGGLSLHIKIPPSQFKLSRCVARRLHAERHQGATYPKPR